MIDARRGLGNGHVIPGGPMRAPLLDQLRLADAILKMGEGNAADLVIRRAARAGKPIFEAVARPREPGGIAGKRLLAFAGIGNPDKFYATVAEAGGTVALTRSFGDHHFYSDDELIDLAATARSAELEIVTTAKDAARLRHGSAAAQSLLERAHVLEIDTLFEPRHGSGASDRRYAEKLAGPQTARLEHNPEKWELVSGRSCSDKKTEPNPIPSEWIGLSPVCAAPD